jgi:hypothetical protein
MGRYTNIVLTTVFCLAVNLAAVMMLGGGIGRGCDEAAAAYENQRNELSRKDTFSAIFL